MTGAVAPEPTAPFGQWVGGQITDHAHCLVQGNPGPMTLDGTNTWVLLAPGGTEAIVIDPGEDEPEHQQRVVEHVSGLGARVARIVVTHGHRDHDEGVPRLVALTGAPVSAVGRGHDDLADGAVLRAGGLEVRVVATPGHTSDSVSFAIEADHALLTGDTVLGRGTTVVAHPDGELAAYLDSLERIAALTGNGAVTSILPGHGPTVPDAAAMVDFYRLHRRERLEQVRAAMAAGATDADAVVATVYAEVDRSVWPAAKMSVLAQMRYLEGA